MYATQVMINDQKVNFLFKLDQDGDLIEETISWFSHNEIVLSSSDEFNQMMRNFEKNIERGWFELVQDDLYKGDEA
jgi:hypothetical protein